MQVGKDIEEEISLRSDGKWELRTAGKLSPAIKLDTNDFRVGALSGPIGWDLAVTFGRTYESGATYLFDTLKEAYDAETKQILDDAQLFDPFGGPSKDHLETTYDALGSFGQVDVAAGPIGGGGGRIATSIGGIKDKDGHVKTVVITVNGELTSPGIGLGAVNLRGALQVDADMPDESGSLPPQPQVRTRAELGVREGFSVDGSGLPLLKIKGATANLANSSEKGWVVEMDTALDMRASTNRQLGLRLLSSALQSDVPGYISAARDAIPSSAQTFTVHEVSADKTKFGGSGSVEGIPVALSLGSKSEFSQTRSAAYVAPHGGQAYPWLNCLAKPVVPSAAPSPSSSAPSGTGTTVSVKVEFDATNQGKYAPASDNVHVGDTVKWSFVDNQEGPHTVTSDDGSTFDSWAKGVTGNAGDTFSFTFTKAGTFSYHCLFHANMTGKITVG